MAIEIVPYTEDWEPMVREFNLRLKAGGVNHRFPESHVPEWLPRIEGRTLFQEYRLAVENGVVRGACILKHQMFTVMDRVLSIGNFQLPLSEGTIDRTYSLVGVRLLSDALARQPLLHCLGMGGFDEPLPKLLKAMGWSMGAVPFFARILHTSQFLRNITYMHRTPLRRAMLDILACTGLGWCGIRAGQMIRAAGSRRAAPSFERIAEFGDWVDELWDSHGKDFTMSAVRDKATLDVLYNNPGRRFIRLSIKDDGRAIGWAVLLATRMANHKYFGNMKVGSIVDCDALANHEPAVIAACEKLLRSENVDLIVTNQCHLNWCTALRRNGFLQGPSNFILAVSRDLANELDPFEQQIERIHINRGDGDRPDKPVTGGHSRFTPCVHSCS